MGLFDQASVWIGRENLAAAEPLLRDAVDIQRRLAPDSVVLGRSLTALGNVIRARGDLGGAEPLLREGADILERLVPDTADFAVALNNLANLLWRRGAVERAEELYDRALSILGRVEPSGPGMAASLMGRGVTALVQGRLAEAEPYMRRALSLEERLAPGTASEARALNNLGSLVKDRGDLLAAEDYLLRSLAIHQRIAPESLNVAGTLHNIGLIHYDRGDPIRAEDYLKRSLELKERLAPGAEISSRTLESLANIARDRGDFAAAEDLFRRSLALKERQAPRSVGVATVLNNLGNVALDRGDLTSARERYETARGLLEEVAPDGLEMATVLDRLVAVAERLGEAAASDHHAARALTIVERVAPGSAVHAYLLRRIGRLARDRGELDRAATVFAQALDAIESQTRRLGGSDEVRTAFAGERRPIYVEYIDVLMTLGQSARAFDVLERSRARSLLMMLAERDLVLDGDLSPELKQTTQTLREEEDQLQESLASLNPRGDAAEMDRLRTRQRELRERRTRVIERVRAASPRLAALRYPEALTLEEVRQALDPGTVMLSYQIGTAASRLFVVRRSATDGHEDFSVHTIAVGEAALRERVTALRRQIERDADAGKGPAPAFVDGARRLYDLLVAPAERTIAAADRVLIVPDGPLHSFPFAALVRHTGESRPWQYFVEWKSLHTTLSATVYAELRKVAPASSGPSTLIAFGEPLYPGPTPAPAGAVSPEVRGMLRRGYALTPLSATRAEVQALSRGFGQRATVYLGAEATEGRAKSLAKTTYLHFATHGLLDERSPLNSSLALTIPSERRTGEENGLLQAWEIFEQLRIDADLVTLSACETALGADVAGEGLIGLTRAFHYAGARTVLASLWRVADVSTSDLMTKIYARLRSGMTKDEALRQAQREAIARPETAAPFHWAAFTLSGDWR
jgi:CHAT domain-containing protein/Tfp pilus assembly protein PilF